MAARPGIIGAGLNHEKMLNASSVEMPTAPASRSSPLTCVAAPLAMTERMPVSIAAALEYISLLAMTAPSGAVKAKYGDWSREILRS